MDFTEWAELRERSRRFLIPWEPEWPADDLSRASFRNRLRRYASEARLNQGYPFFVFRTSDRLLVGGVTLSNVRRGVAQAANLGYWMGEPFARKGYMSAAVTELFCFAWCSRTETYRGRVSSGKHGVGAVVGKIGFRAKVMRANIFALQEDGRTICSTRV